MAQIKTYARLKPSKKPYSGYEICKNILTVHIPDSKDFLLQGSQQPPRSNIYDIVFTDIFRPEATQEDVFGGVAKDIIESFLNGYNGTIFAYGQTGTGKTYTVEGNTSRYSTRGLSTRALSMIYQQLENRAEDHITVCLSYLEIYQEVAYDLLNPVSKSSLPMAPFTKVTVVEGPRGSCIFRGLSVHYAANEEMAQMLLLQGQANRRVAETPVNQRSSRSHAVFTVYLQVRRNNSDVLLSSKLHLVDLAGSERVSKTGVDGQQLTEAKSINLSLHHLETVIIALQTDRSSSTSSSSGGDRSRAEYPPTQSRSNTSFMSGPSSDSGSKPLRFVPYRNSLLTMVLKDSLGGNCLTAMIATISMEPENLGESISTCRFAQRVARIANNARRNEEVDDKILIKRLKHKVANLENQVALLRSKGTINSVIADEEMLVVLSDEDRTNCARIMEGFLQGVITDPVDAGIYDQCRFRECLHLLKCHYMHLLAHNSQFQTLQQQHPQLRQITGDQSDESLMQMEPNNPHRDSGDHVVPEAPQRDANIRGNQQRHSVSSHSLTSVVGCEDYYPANKDSVAGASSLVKAQNLDKKDSDIDQLEVSYGGCSYRYDKQRSKELKKLGQKLTSLEQEQADKQDQLEQMKQNTLMQELLAAENNLRLKLQGVDEQVTDQHAYILHLKHMQADEVQIAKEHSVGQHLLKRRAKFHEKLCKLLENKAELERTLLSKRDTNSIICGACNRVALNDRLFEMKQGKDSAHTRPAYDSPNSEEQKLNPAKFDREKFILKSKQVSLKEASTLDRLRELKQRLRSTQQQQEEENFQAGRNLGQNVCQNYQITVSSSVDSDHSLRDRSLLYINSHPSSSSAANKEFQHDQMRAVSSKGSSRTGLEPTECSLSVLDQQVKLVQECQAQGNRDRHASDTRQSRYSGPVKQGEAAMETNNYSIFVSPYQQELYIPVLRAEDSASKVSVQGALNELLQQNGIGPTEVRSFHDPHHSHKFALDDRLAVEGSSSVNSPTAANTADGFSNKNNSYIRLMRSHKCCCHNTNFNTNANSDNLEQQEAKKDDKQQPASCLDHQKQTSASNVISSNIDDYSSNCAPKSSSLKMESTFHDCNGSQIKMLKDIARTAAEYHQPMNLEKNNKSPIRDLRCTCNNTPSVTARYLDEKIKECVKPSSISPQHVTQPRPSAVSLPVKRSSISPRRITQPGPSAVSLPVKLSSISPQHVTQPGTSAVSLPVKRSSISPHHVTQPRPSAVSLAVKRSSSSPRHITQPGPSAASLAVKRSSISLQHVTQPGPSAASLAVIPSSISLQHLTQPGPSAASLPFVNSNTIVTDYDKPQKAVGSPPHRTFESALYHMLEPGEKKTDTNPPHRLTAHKKHSVASTMLANEHRLRNNAGSTLHNLFVEQDLPGHHHAQCNCMPPQGRYSEYKLSNMEFSSGKMSNSLQKTLAKSRQRELVDSIGNESEADPFFGLQQMKMKIRALTPEEREKTYMSAVAAEKARIANIRKARRAAEIIQRHWRAYKTEE